MIVVNPETTVDTVNLRVILNDNEIEFSEEPGELIEGFEIQPQFCINADTIEIERLMEANEISADYFDTECD